MPRAIANKAENTCILLTNQHVSNCTEFTSGMQVEIDTSCNAFAKLVFTLAIQPITVWRHTSHTKIVYTKEI